METQSRKMRRAIVMHPSTLIVAASLLVPTLSGCGRSGSSAPPPPIDASGGRMAPPPVGGQARQGMSTRKKVLILAGAAALYYMYKKQQNAKGETVQYYKSETNGRIYYRDPKTHQAIYVTPPAQGIQVPAEEAQDYSNYKGYNNQPTGENFGGWGASQPAN